jgi:hypothetical protein
VNLSQHFASPRTRPAAFAFSTRAKKFDLGGQFQPIRFQALVFREVLDITAQQEQIRGNGIPSPRTGCYIAGGQI